MLAGIYFYLAEILPPCLDAGKKLMSLSRKFFDLIKLKFFIGSCLVTICVLVLLPADFVFLAKMSAAFMKTPIETFEKFENYLPPLAQPFVLVALSLSVASVTIGFMKDLLDEFFNKKWFQFLHLFFVTTAFVCMAIFYISILANYPKLKFTYALGITSALFASSPFIIYFVEQFFNLICAFICLALAICIVFLVQPFRLLWHILGHVLGFVRIENVSSQNADEEPFELEELIPQNGDNKKNIYPW